ncbi:MAG: replicative DNA helicase [Alphaproteobacteria bacterium]|nr:MAG: replicative DNA helicase [Alphaproteobacteria bacterium]
MAQVKELKQENHSSQEHAFVAPQNLQAEQALLAALLINNKSLESIIEFLAPEHFADAFHGEIYAAIMHFADRNKIADPTTLQNYFGDKECQEYLFSLANNVISVINVEDYARTIYDLYLRRELIDIGEHIVNDSRDFKLDTTSQDIIEESEQKLFHLATHKTNSIISFKQALNAAVESTEHAFKSPDKIVGVGTGFKDLDHMLGGFHKSDLLILAGRPSMGKTALATNIAFNSAKRFKETGAPVAFFSLEMSSEQLALRILSAEAHIPSDKMRRGEIHEHDFKTITKTSFDLQNLPLYIDDTPGLSIMALRNRARRLKRQHGIGMIVIDYLQLLSAQRKSNDSRVQEISEITRLLKNLAKELDVPILALSQLSRAVEQREDKRPQLADLRESGTIEQDADVVMFVYRPEYYEARKMPTADENDPKHIEWKDKMAKLHKKAELIVAKQRHGPVGSVKLGFDGRITKFENLEDGK